jgi:hypothetical protein
VRGMLASRGRRGRDRRVAEAHSEGLHCARRAYQEGARCVSTGHVG